MIPFKIFKNDRFICYGKSAKSFAKVSENILGIKLDYNGIRKCLIGDIKSYQGYTFEKILDFKERREVLCKDDSF